ncbi:uncharacterized protein LOC132160267 isoform X3 [Carassius carassius]|uniref:uncharacterized protein LOC132160267 isoform X3 n=1 Tax=Carassius carassius TaxID=217509 RepID=UPI0028690963|nr:uncharacterized protein LOC132160267 isoform X3 [Carassius carassius]XP_059425996.1 uncharacterized protein LOC132160267 isoform X3 [Carassius carassius]
MDFLSGVSGGDETVSMSVMEGDSVTLHMDLTQTQNDDTILWMFGPKDSIVSQITRKNDLTSLFLTDDERFIGRLQVDQNTGSLTIRNTRITHTGQYKLTVSRKKTTIKIFSVTVFGVVNETDGVKSVSVMEGDPVTLQTDAEIHSDDLIVWRFGDKGILLAKLYVGTNESSLNDADERFKDRLQLNQTGSLTITNTRTEHAGLYEVQIRGSESSQRFLLSVTAAAVLGLSPGATAGITVIVLLAVAVLIYCQCKNSKLEKQVCENQSVKEGESVTLLTGLTEIHKDEKIQWWYEDKNNLIAIHEINGVNSKRAYPGVDGRFRSKLGLDDLGNLTISNVRTIHTGLYNLKISSRGRITKYKRFILTVGVRTHKVQEGEPVPLRNNAEIQTGDLILWTFGAENRLVAIKDSRTTEIFSDRLELDDKTGSLTIKDIRTTDSGHFKLQIINSQKTTFRRFNIDVTDVVSTEKQEKGEKGAAGDEFNLMRRETPSSVNHGEHLSQSFLSSSGQKLI